MSEYITHEHDVLIIGAGAPVCGCHRGLGRRCKGRGHYETLLGKAHTVMPMVAAAAAMGNGRPRQLACSLCRHHAWRSVSE